jgi:hypothetical protein
MGQSQPFPSASPLQPDVFFIGIDSHGNWVAQDARHRRCGIFVTEEAARRFIKSESVQRPTIISVPEPLEFNLDG